MHFRKAGRRGSPTRPRTTRVDAIAEYEAAIFYAIDAEARRACGSTIATWSTRRSSASSPRPPTRSSATSTSATRRHPTPAYTRLPCASPSCALKQARLHADVLPELGKMSWSRAMGAAACDAVIAFLQAHTPRAIAGRRSVLRSTARSSPPRTRAGCPRSASSCRAGARRRRGSSGSIADADGQRQPSAARTTVRGGPRSGTRRRRRG